MTQNGENRIVALKCPAEQKVVLVLDVRLLGTWNADDRVEANAEKTKYTVMSRDQNPGQNGNIQIGNESFETVEQFKNLGTTLTNENSFHEEVESRLKSGNAGCQSVQNLLSSGLLSKNVKIKIYRIIILPFVLCG
jgi:hypothetical protein